MGVTASLDYPAYFLGSGPLTSFVPSLAPGESKAISWTLTPASRQMPASHYMELRLDSANGGSQRESLRIESQRPPTPRVYRREIPLEAVRNEPFRVSYEVTNVGDATLPSAVVVLTLPTGVTATTHTTKSVGPLMPGASAVVEWELIGRSIGTKHIGVRAESPASPFTDALSDLVEIVPPGSASPWQNPAGPWDTFGNALDVSGDGLVVPLDALLLINELNHPLHHADSGLLEIPPPAGFPPPYYDVNGDGLCLPLDALIVINFLNNPPEGEFAAICDVAETAPDLSRLALPTAVSSEWIRARGTHRSWGWPKFTRFQISEEPNSISQNGTNEHHGEWHALPRFAFGYDPLPRRPDRTVVDDAAGLAIEAEADALESILSEIALDVCRALAAFGVSH